MAHVLRGWEKHVGKPEGRKSKVTRSQKPPATGGGKRIIMKGRRGLALTVTDAPGKPKCVKTHLTRPERDAERGSENGVVAGSNPLGCAAEY